MGNLGVAVFFSLSGFMVTQSMFRSPGPWWFLDYARKRVARLFPALVVVSVVMALMVGPLVSSLQVRVLRAGRYESVAVRVRHGHVECLRVGILDP